MANYENEIVLPRGQAFQAVIGYRDPDRIPPLVARQTSTLLSLFHQGAIYKPDLAIDYLRGYALNYLNMAEKGVDAVYDRTSSSFEEFDVEVTEAADFAYVIFAHLPGLVKSPWLPNGFSRRGMLKAPETEKEFLGRIRELKIGIWQVVGGEMEPQTTLEAYPSLLRTFGFFKVGGELPIKLSEDERKMEAMGRERFNDLLGGIDVSLLNINLMEDQR